MGLIISHGSFPLASYRNFSRLRQAIAEVLALRCAFVDVRPKPTDANGWQAYEEEEPVWRYLDAVHGMNYLGEEQGKEHPWYEMDISVEMKTFLSHSDCSGVIFHEMLKKLSNELELLVDKIDEDFKEMLITLIKGFRLAHNKGEDILFH